MLVRFWMAKQPVVATEDMNLEEALDLMRKHKIRRLPVVSEEKKLCGIIALSDLYPYMGPYAMTKAKFLDKGVKQMKHIFVASIMTRSPITCDHNAPIEEIGALMRRKKIGAVPVVDEGNLIGIITESDVLDALANIAQTGSDSRRICFRIPTRDKMNIFYNIVALCEKDEIEILALLTHPVPEEQYHLVTMRVRGERLTEFIDALWRNHYEVLTS